MSNPKIGWGKSHQNLTAAQAALSCTEKDRVVEVSLHGENNHTEKARYVIDCESVVGTLKRQIARQYAGKITGEVPGYITTYQTFNEGSIDLDPHYFYAYLQPELSEYDAWFNVKDDLLVLGVSVKDMEKSGIIMGASLPIWRKSTICGLAGRRKRKSG